MNTLSGKHAVITGGGTGIGLAIAQAFKTEGATLTLMARNLDRLNQAATKLGDNVTVIECDVTDPESVTKAFEQAEHENGMVDILVNNAGAAESAPFAKTSLESWNRMLDVNLTGPFLCSQAVIHNMTEANEGRIITISSTAGLKAFHKISAYGAAKHGVIGLTRNIAFELAKTNITANCICPGFTQTDIAANAIQNIVKKTGMTAQEAESAIISTNPQGRMIKPEEIAATAVWLASDAAKSTTGQSIAISGGETM